MNYTKCECKTENVIPCEGREAARNQSMTEMVQEIKGIAADITAIASRVNAHMFGTNDQQLSSSNMKEVTCLSDDIENILRMLLETAMKLNDTCYKLGC